MRWTRRLPSSQDFQVYYQPKAHSPEDHQHLKIADRGVTSSSRAIVFDDRCLRDPAHYIPPLPRRVQSGAPTILSGVLTGLGQSDRPHIIDGLAHIARLTIKIEILQDPQYDCLADPAGSDGIEHPQHHPASEFPRRLLQFNFIVQDISPFSIATSKVVWEKLKPRCYFARGPTTLSGVLKCGEG